jgi:hypothetical protein
MLKSTIMIPARCLDVGKSQPGHEGALTIDDLVPPRGAGRARGLRQRKCLLELILGAREVPTLSQIDTKVGTRRWIVRPECDKMFKLPQRLLLITERVRVEKRELLLHPEAPRRRYCSPEKVFLRFVEAIERARGLKCRASNFEVLWPERCRLAKAGKGILRHAFLKQQPALFNGLVARQGL